MACLTQTTHQNRRNIIPLLLSTLCVVVIRTSCYMKLHVREILYYKYLLFQHCLQSQWGEGVFKSIITIDHKKGVILGPMPPLI